MKPLTLFSDKKESYFLMNKDDLLLVFYKISVGSGYIFNIDEVQFKRSHQTSEILTRFSVLGLL